MTRADTQVLLCDLQPQIVVNSKTNPPAALAASAAVLARVARILGLPMTFSMVPEGGAAPELILELQPFASPQTLFPRVSASPFLDHATARVMREYGRKTLVIAGFATEVASCTRHRGRSVKATLCRFLPMQMAACPHALKVRPSDRSTCRRRHHIRGDNGLDLGTRLRDIAGQGGVRGAPGHSVELKLRGQCT
jgi:hypothetical protein